jgi:hypothetical protein
MTVGVQATEIGPAYRLEDSPEIARIRTELGIVPGCNFYKTKNDLHNFRLYIRSGSATM